MASISAWKAGAERAERRASARSVAGPGGERQWASWRAKHHRRACRRRRRAGPRPRRPHPSWAPSRARAAGAHGHPRASPPRSSIRANRSPRSDAPRPCAACLTADRRGAVAWRHRPTDCRRACGAQRWTRRRRGQRAAAGGVLSPRGPPPAGHVCAVRQPRGGRARAWRSPFPVVPLFFIGGGGRLPLPSHWQAATPAVRFSSCARALLPDVLLALFLWPVVTRRGLPTTRRARPCRHTPVEIGAAALTAATRCTTCSSRRLLSPHLGRPRVPPSPPPTTARAACAWLCRSPGTACLAAAASEDGGWSPPLPCRAPV